ncbi:RHS repeat domain-containing protein, partial [Escherichia coli]|uniref:RHS repeat domain-containing protein n=1 Tax=Escherichia coli TaxID=562 RepID=UPI0025A61FC1
ATAENSVVPFNRLMSYRGVHYRYDEFGRAVEKEGRSGTQSYRYDAEHRMVEVTTARGTYRYVYDALGRWTEKQHISPDGKPYNRTTFLWDGMRLAQESRPEGTDSLYIYRDPGSYEPLARVDKAGKEGPNRILYFHTDVNGAPEEMTDSDGKIVWETGYQVWGNTIQEKDHGGVEQNLRYQGQYLDRETGLHYNLHRYHDPDVGRFMVTDPIGLAGGLNLYQYAPNPLSWIDPLGLKCSPEQLAKNRKAGALHEVNTTAVLKAKYGQNAVHEQVYIRPLDANGKPVNYRVRLDNVIEHQGPGAKPSLIDAKASSTAPYTHNQKKGYPLISKNGGVIESGPMSGTRVGPTDVIRIEPVDLSRGSY